MSTTRPFAYNIGSPITGTTQLGDLAIGVDNLNYSQQPGGVQWWNGPDEELGYIITHTTPSGTQPNPLGIPAYLGFWRSKVKTEGSFIVIAQWVSAKHGDPQIFATGLDASTWLNNNGYWTSYDQVILTPTPTPTETQPEPTPTPTETEVIPTPTPTETEVIPTPTPTETQPEPTPTPTETQPEPTPTPTPTETPIPVTGYGFNLVALPYDFPLSGNSIMNNDPSTGNSGSTEINVLGTSGRGFYFNTLDENGVDRTSYFSTFTGQNITITFNQGGNVAIYSGDTDSLKYYNQTGQTGFVFGTGIGLPPSPSPSGVATLIQSSPVNYTIGLPVYVSVELNVPLTPTPTPTETQPEPTPTPTETQPEPTPTPTETQPIPTPTPTETQPIPTPTPTETQPIPTPTPTSGATGYGWSFYTPEGTLQGPPSSSGQTVFVIPSGVGPNVSTFNPNYTGSNISLYFNEYTTDGVSYNTEFQNLDTNGGTITITQNGDSVTYSGTALNFLYGTSPNNFLGVQVTNSSQLISPSAAPFVSGSPITLIINGSPSPTPTPTPTSTPTLANVFIGNADTFDTAQITAIIINSVAISGPVSGYTSLPVIYPQDTLYTTTEVNGSYDITVSISRPFPSGDLSLNVEDSNLNVYCVTVNNSGDYTINDVYIEAGNGIGVYINNTPCPI